MQYLNQYLSEADVRAGAKLAADPSLDAIDTLLGKLYTPAGIAVFLMTPAKVFGGKTALDLIRHGEYGPVLSELAWEYNGDGY